MEIYAKEKSERHAAEGQDLPQRRGISGIRALKMQDFIDALQQVGPSVSSLSASTTELEEWNTLHGEVWSTKSELNYYI